MANVIVTGFDEAPRQPTRQRLGHLAADRNARDGRKLERALRTADVVLTPDERIGSRAANAVHPRVPAVYETVRVRVNVYDGHEPIHPQVLLTSVSPLMRIYPKPTARRSRGQPGAAGDADTAQEPEPTLVDVLKANVAYRKILAEALVRRDARDFVNPQHTEVREARPIFYMKGRQIKPDSHALAPLERIVTVQDVMRQEAKSLGVGFMERTLDVALNREADLYLSGRYYSKSISMLVFVEMAEMSASVAQDAPFGLPPSTYVIVEHGTEKRYTHVEYETRTPQFDWSSGPLPYASDEPVKVRLMLAQHAEPRENDPVVGQFWLPAPALPLPRHLVFPSISAYELGSNVGYLHVAFRGPVERRTHLPGCQCSCPCVPGCNLAICGSPPCCPSLGIWARQVARFFTGVVTGGLGQATVALVCCFCFLVLGMVVAGFILYLVYQVPRVVDLPPVPGLRSEANDSAD